jgi:hypothetical protein
MPKKKLTDLSQVDGKIRKEEEKETPEYQPTTLDQLFGDTGLSKYNTLKQEEYEGQLEEMNSAELRRHAIEVAHVVPAISPERTKKRLLIEFQKHVTAYQIPKTPAKKDKEPSKAALRIMSECK